VLINSQLNFDSDTENRPYIESFNPSTSYRSWTPYHSESAEI